MKRRNVLITTFILLAIMAEILCGDLASGQIPVARFFYDEKGNVSRQEKDTNGDGKMDRWIFFNTEGKIDRVEQDENFDGKPDISFFYEKGKLKRQEISTGRDGRTDYLLYGTLAGYLKASALESQGQQ